MVVNLLFLIYIAVAYILFFKRIKKSQQNVQTARNEKAERKEMKMRKRITYIVLTDIACWLPIIVMSIVSFGGYELPDFVHPISAIILLPINSLINPIIYSRIDKTFKNYLKGVFERNCPNLCSKKKVQKTEENIPMNQLGDIPQNQG